MVLVTLPLDEASDIVWLQYIAEQFSKLLRLRVLRNMFSMIVPICDLVVTQTTLVLHHPLATMGYDRSH